MKNFQAKTKATAMPHWEYDQEQRQAKKASQELRKQKQGRKNAWQAND